MPSYTYIATNPIGQKEEGTITAENRDAAITRLQEQKLIILNLQSKDEKDTAKRKKLRLSRVEKLLFTKHLSAMIGAGLNLIEALSIMEQQKPGKNMKTLLINLSSLIRGGQTLGNSLDFFKGTFSPIFVNMVKVGEEGGNLDEVLSYLEVQLEKDYELVKKVKGALIYPVVILSVTMILALFLITFIIPKITRIFSSFDVKLPITTRLLIGMNDAIKTDGLKILIAGVAIIFFIKWLKNRSFVQPYTHSLLLKIPVFGKLARFANTARFCRITSSLLKSGVPVVKTLEVVAETIQNIKYKTAIQASQKRVQNGDSLGQSLSQYESLFPPLVSHMIQVGEKTGTLEHTTENLALMYEKDVDDITKNISTLMEPFLLLIMGVVVGGIALSIIAPIYQIPQLVQGK